MFAPSVLQPRKSEVKHGVRHREQPRKQEARRQRANRNTTPSTSATASIARESQSPQRARARQRAPGRKPGGFAADHVLVSRPPPSHARPPRAPGRKPGSGALAGPSSGLRGANRAEQRVPRALAGPSSELPLRRIANFVQPWSKETILRRLRAKTHDSSRYRKPIREQPTKTSVSHFRDREKPSVLTASDQN